MNEDEEIQRLMGKLTKVRKALDSIGDFEDMSFDNLEECETMLKKLDTVIDELQDDYAVTDFLLNGSRMATCPEK